MTLFLAAVANGGGQNMLMIVLFIGLGLFTYFVMLRPQKKAQQKRLDMMGQLKPGDQVVLVDGLHGKVDAINEVDKTVVIDADGIYLTFSRMAVREVIPSQPAETDKVVKSTETPESQPEDHE
ncbi:MAG: preprotein translocase subunit YajC [Lactobacillus sp.]|nr:preprotein translocase subunit YajC [Lactobacillus sp.]MDN6052707.1 preprotein translocase subunit YajC [Lactobacillus sp.]